MSQAFSGTQNVSSIQKDEAWRVNVRIQGCDLEHGYLCGTMEALNVPMADTPVSTSSIWFFHLTTTRNINNSFVCVCVCVCMFHLAGNYVDLSFSVNGKSHAFA